MNNQLVFKKSLLSFLFSTICLFTLLGQTAEIDHHKKYWYYKSRFNNDFVSIGTSSGQRVLR